MSTKLTAKIIQEQVGSISQTLLGPGQLSNSSDYDSEILQVYKIKEGFFFLKKRTRLSVII